MAGRMSILLVEDDLRVAAVTSRMLGRRHDVVVTHTVDAALAELSTRSFDAVISDFELGDATGEAVLAYAASAHPETRRVLYSGSPRRGPAEQLAHAVLEKPATLEEFDGALFSV